MTAAFEKDLTPDQAHAVEEAERLWRARETGQRWDRSEATCELLLEWLRRPERSESADLAAELAQRRLWLATLQE